MKLYQYMHCPYCVRVDMVANYTKVAHEKIFLLNDDEKTCFDLIGKKMVPILQFDDGTAMGESLDIVVELKKVAVPGRTLAEEQDAKVSVDILTSARFDINCLLFPRDIALGLPEFETESARAYFQKKKEQLLGLSFEEALAATDDHVALVSSALKALPNLPLSKRLAMDDVLIFPVLRNLTMVKAIHFPKQVRAYIEHIGELTEVPLFFDKAI